MTYIEKKNNVKKFKEDWKDKGSEKQHTQSFWNDLLRKVLGVEDTTEFIQYEEKIKLERNATGYIDAYIPKTKVMIEQKSLGVNLNKAEKQSDGEFRTPYEQAKRYSDNLNFNEKARWIVISDFKSFVIYDMNNIHSEPEVILLENLDKDYYRLEFLVDEKDKNIKREEEISFKAGELVGKIYDAFSKEYNDITNKQSQKDLNELCVRIVFCLYAEDAGLFGKRNAFHDYLSKYDNLDLMRESLIKLFKILDTKEEERDPYLEDDLKIPICKWWTI